MPEKTGNLTLSLFKEKIPKKCFEKSLPRSLAFMVWDLMVVSACFFSYDFFAPSWIGLFVYWNITGFAMWCLFVIGHDCGHDSFSNYPLINAICGHICHTPLLVPYFPWAYSHLQHHRFHNHIHKDKSHPWLTKSDLKKFNRVERFYRKSLLAPFTLFIFYLYFGMKDGSHIYPIGKLYQNAPRKEKIKCIISLGSLIFLVSMFFLVFASWEDFFLRYFGAWIFFNFWLFLVTYLHHHDENPVVFDHSSWDFVSGALETIDRKYGWGIDQLHHHISDAHLVHHLFFSQIPHYHLVEATKAVRSTLKENYKFKKHRCVLLSFWPIFFRTNFHKWRLYQKPHHHDPQ